VSFETLSTKSVLYRDDLLRNIKGIRQSQDLFDDLALDAQDALVAQAAQSQARGQGDNPLVQRPFEYGSVITYTFDASHWQATRFSDGRSYGVWYGCTELETTVYETAYHWHRFLTDSFAGENRVIRGERRVFRVACDALLVDLRGLQRKHPELVDRRDYTYCQSLGRYLVSQQQNGLLVASARRAGGINAALFTPHRLSGVRDLCFLTYKCNPSVDKMTIERTPGRSWLRFTPSSLY
jgi:RES domain